MTEDDRPRSAEEPTGRRGAGPPDSDGEIDRDVPSGNSDGSESDRTEEDRDARDEIPEDSGSGVDDRSADASEADDQEETTESDDGETEDERGHIGEIGNANVDLAAPTSSDSRVRQWVLLRGNRLVVSGAIIVSVFLTLVGANRLWPFEMLELVTETGTVGTLLNTLLSGTILLVSVVVSINSIGLSQDLTSVGTQRNRLENAVAFRESVEELAGLNASPTDPSEFLGASLSVVVERSTRLASAFEDDAGNEVSDRATDLARIVETNTGLIRRRVERADPNSVEVLVAGLQYSYSDKIRAVQQLQAEYGETLSVEQRESIEGLIEALKLYAVAHEYFKSLFYMREFAKLSKTLLYVALPVIVITAYVMLAIDAGQVPEGTVAGLSGLTLFTMAAFSVALTPYVVFTAFVLRSATIAARSLAVGPFSMDRQ